MNKRHAPIQRCAFLSAALFSALLANSNIANAAPCQPSDQDVNALDQEATRILNDCRASSMDEIVMSGYRTGCNRQTNQRVDVHWPTCRRDAASNDPRNSGRYGSSRSSERRDRDPNSNCNYATEFDPQGGGRCRVAENTIRNVQSRGRAMQEVQTTGAAALQVANAMQPVRTQQDAMKQTQFNLRAAMATSALELGNSMYSARELSQAETEARSAERGIKNAREAYGEAVEAGVAAAGGQGARFRARLDSTNTAQALQQSIERDNSATRLAGARNAPPGARMPLGFNNDQAQAVARARVEAEQAGARAFTSKLEENGLNDTARRFDSFESMRSNTSRGIRESNEVAEQASGAASTARVQALGNALQLASAYSAYRQTKQTTNNLATLPGAVPPTFALGTNTAAPTVPGLEAASVTPSGAPELDNSGDFVNAQARDPMRGGIGSVSAGGTPFKPRQAQFTGGGGGRGVSGGGGGAGPSKQGQGRSYAGASNVDYDGGGGGRYVNNAGGGPGDNSDVQDALASILGGEQNPVERSLEFRELASVEESERMSNDGDSIDDPRTIFERVNEKYQDVVIRGDVNLLSPTAPSAG